MSKLSIDIIFNVLQQPEQGQEPKQVKHASEDEPKVCRIGDAQAEDEVWEDSSYL